MQQLPDGRLVPATREAQIIINTFGASTPNVGFERPAYEQLGMDANEIRKFEEEQARIKQQFANHLAWRRRASGRILPEAIRGPAVRHSADADRGAEAVDRSGVRRR